MTLYNQKKNIEEVPDLSDHVNNSSRRISWKISKDLPSSFQYAAKGIEYAWKSQRNFRIHTFIGLVVLSFAIWLELPLIHLAIIANTIGVVLILELINTSIEAVVDLSIGRRFHPLARIAKDCAAASVLIGSMTALIIASLLILPSILDKFGA